MQIRRRVIRRIYVAKNAARAAERESLETINMAPINRSAVLIICLHKRMLMKRKRRHLRWNLLLLYLKKRALIINICYLSLLLLTRSVAELARKPRIRSCRRLTRKTGWWGNVRQNYSNLRFKLTFRVSRETFGLFLSEYGPNWSERL